MAASRSINVGRRGPNFSLEEDEALCKAWVAIGEDSVVGICQTGKRFWERALDAFHEILNYQTGRSSKGISGRWGVIQLAVNKFCGFLGQLEEVHQSGMTMQNRSDRQTARTYNLMQNTEAVAVELPSNIFDDGDSFRRVKQRFSDKTKKVAETKEKTKEILSKQAVKIAKQAEEHERFITKVTHLCGVLGFGTFCFLLGARPQDIPYVYCLFFVTFVPLRWIYYRFMKWHYYLLDFCYYANTIFLVMLLLFPRNEKFFMVCFSFAEGPLAWALIVWRCSLVFSSLDKLVSVLIHLLPGIVFFTIRWWDPATFEAMHPEGNAGRRASWPYAEGKSYLWTWLFVVPLVAYTLWQILYFLIVNVLRRQRLLRDPEVMTSYRELSKKAQKANNVWWRLSGLLGDQNRMLMYILLQAAFTVATMALTVPIFLSYKMHVIFQVLKVCAAIWNGGSFLLEVMPRQVILKEKKKLEMKPIPTQLDPTVLEKNITENGNMAEAGTEINNLAEAGTEINNLGEVPESEQPCTNNSNGL